MRIMEAQSGGAGMTLPMMGKIMQLNPEHVIIKRLNELIENDPENEKIDILIHQIHDNTRIVDGDVPDFTSMLTRIEKIMEYSVKSE